MIKIKYLDEREWLVKRETGTKAPKSPNSKSPK